MSESTPPPQPPPPLQLCPRCQRPPNVRFTGYTVHQVFCTYGCYSVQGTVEDWNDMVIGRKLLANLRRIAKTCKEDTISNGDGPTTFELNWEPDHQYQALIIWHHHDGPIPEQDAAGETFEEAISHLATQLKRSY